MSNRWEQRPCAPGGGRRGSAGAVRTAVVDRGRLRRLAFTLAALSLASACQCGSPTPAAVDADRDGSPAGQDCDDADPARAPGRAETCDGKDNDCDADVDEGTTCDCVPGSAPRACGTAGSCQQACGSDGRLAACLPPGATTVDLATDPANCGECGHACPAPSHAAGACRAGVCGRGPCEAGFFDLDGAATFGCEATCSGTTCTGPSGTVMLTAPPLREPAALTGPSSGSSFGSQTQTNAQHTHVGVLGESVPEASSATHKHFGGFTSGLR